MLNNSVLNNLNTVLETELKLHELPEDYMVHYRSHKDHVLGALDRYLGSLEDPSSLDKKLTRYVNYFRVLGDNMEYRLNYLLEVPAQLEKLVPYNYLMES